MFSSDVLSIIQHSYIRVHHFCLHNFSYECTSTRQETEVYTVPDESLHSNIHKLKNSILTYKFSNSMLVTDIILPMMHLEWVNNDLISNKIIETVVSYL